MLTIFKVAVLIILILGLGLGLFSIKPNIKSSADKNDSGKFLIDQTEDERSLGYTGQKKVVMDSRGNVFIGYRKKVNDIFEVFIARFKDGNVELVQLTRDSKYNQRVPSLFAEGNTLYVVWYGAPNDGKENNRQIYFAKSSDKGGNFEGHKNISNIGGFRSGKLWQEHPDIVVKNGKVYVAWEGRDPQNKKQQIKFAKSNDRGNNWTSPTNIVENSRFSHSRPTILMDEKGKLHIFMYSDLESKKTQIWHSISSSDGDFWENWENLSKSQKDSRHAFGVTVDDKIYLAYRGMGDKKRSKIFLTVFDGKNWTDPQILSDSKNYQFFPSIGTDQDNNIYISWMETKKKSKLPKEEPRGGEVFGVILKNGDLDLVDKKNFSAEKKDGYPNVLYKNTKDDQSYLVFESGKKKYQIFLQNYYP